MRKKKIFSWFRIYLASIRISLKHRMCTGIYPKVSVCRMIYLCALMSVNRGPFATIKSWLTLTCVFDRSKVDICKCNYKYPTNSSVRPGAIRETNVYSDIICTTDHLTSPNTVKQTCNAHVKVLYFPSSDAKRNNNFSQFMIVWNHLNYFDERTFALPLT